MDAQAAETIFTLLVGAGLVLTTLVMTVAPDAIRTEFTGAAFTLAAAVAIAATAGSLYFSEVRNFTPCELCWYQRIAMYPLAVILPVALVRKDRSIVPYGIILAGLGAAVSIYHYQLQAFPDQGSTCSTDAPCSFRWVEVFGFVSIPLLALGSFILIIALLAISTRSTSTTGGQQP
ncbi:MAG: disulfide oxidoreductase [Acidimicrobiales bacterium]